MILVNKNMNYFTNIGETKKELSIEWEKEVEKFYG